MTKGGFYLTNLSETQKKSIVTFVQLYFHFARNSMNVEIHLKKTQPTNSFFLSGSRALSTNVTNSDWIAS